MQQIRHDIIKMVCDIADKEKLKVIYQFIRGIKSGR